MKTTVLTVMLGLGLSLFSTQTKAQDDESNDVAGKYIPSIGVHGGAMSFLGDVGDESGNAIYTNVRLGYGAYLEKNFADIISARLSFTMGKLSQNEFDENGNFRNFESDIMQFDARAIFDFDNNLIINKSSYFSPFIGVGFAYLQFDPYGDLKDANGSEYHFWSDGTIRDMPESDTTIESSSIIQRDYEYETQLNDSASNYDRTTFSVPLQLGFKFKVSEHLFARVSGAYHLTFTDYIDNYAEGGNDSYLYTSFAMQYNFGSSGKKRDKSDDKRYEDVDFSSIENTDTDKDGVSDFKDYCPNTKEGVEVDAKGCPPDTDKDGVPDYMDKEPNTAEGARVNAEGVTMTEEMIAAERQKRDSIQVQKTQFYSEELSEEERNEIKAQYKDQINQGPKIPEKYKFVDADNDGYITAKEVTGAIDGFFEGSNDLTVKDLNDLVDFFFEQ